MKIKNWPTLIGSILICEGVGIIAGIFTVNSINNWYNYLDKPFFSPPNFIFGPVWTILYFTMGVSVYLIWESTKNKQRTQALYVFGAQLILNFLWSFLFFGLRSPILGFIGIIALWISIFVTLIKFKAISKAAFYLLIPYIMWVSFAGILNLAVLILN